MNYEEAKKAFSTLFDGVMSHDEARAFLVSMYERGESEEEIRSAVEVMRGRGIPFVVTGDLKELLIDNCGTGGDKSGSFNISTTVSFVLASLGLYVAKHGNRSITSKSGSADMLEALGIKIDLDEKSRVAMLEETGFVFLFAPLFHPALKHIMPIRKSIDHRTIFNLLGPLCNPAGVERHLIGVYDFSFAKKCAEALKNTGSKSGIIVSGRDGMDEGSICAVSDYVYFDEKGVKSFELDPEAYGLKLHKSCEIAGGEAKENATITYNLLKNGDDTAKLSAVMLNTALALVGAQKASDIKEGLEMAEYAVKSKKAFATLEKIIDFSKKV